MIYPIVEGVSHGGRSVDWLRDKIFFGPDMMYLKCANPLISDACVFKRNACMRYQNACVQCLDACVTYFWDA